MDLNTNIAVRMKQALQVFALAVQPLLSSYAVRCGSSFKAEANFSSYHITDCRFQSLSSQPGSGGAIYAFCASSTIDISRATFTSCSSSIKGGAVFSSGLMVSISRTCGISCSSACAQFVYSESFGDFGNISCNHTSFSECSSKSSSSNIGMYFSSGEVDSGYVNTSEIWLSSDCPGPCFSSGNFTYVTFLTAINCRSESCGIIGLGSCGFTSLSQSNIINNSQNLASKGIISLQGTAEILKCVLCNNSGAALIFADDASLVLFVKCWISHEDKWPCVSFSSNSSGNYSLTVDCSFGTTNSIAIPNSELYYTSSYCGFCDASSSITQRSWKFWTLLFGGMTAIFAGLFISSMLLLRGIGKQKCYSDRDFGSFLIRRPI